MVTTSADGRNDKLCHRVIMVAAATDATNSRPAPANGTSFTYKGSCRKSRISQSDWWNLNKILMDATTGLRMSTVCKTWRWNDDDGWHGECYHYHFWWGWASVYEQNVCMCCSDGSPVFQAVPLSQWFLCPGCCVGLLQIVLLTEILLDVWVRFSGKKQKTLRRRIKELREGAFFYPLLSFFVTWHISTYKIRVCFCGG